MIKYFFLIFILPHLLINNSDTQKIFVAKIDWHVGIILEVNEKLVSKVDAIKQFSSFDYIDIGWGDAEFYQSQEDFDLYLAAKAVLLPTPSVIRIKGYNVNIDQIMEWRDYFFEIVMSDSQFDTLCTFINNSFTKNNNDELVKTSEQFGSRIKFFSSSHSYHLAYTCNTWVADALESSGLEIDASNVITAEHLLGELTNCGKLLKLDN